MRSTGCVKFVIASAVVAALAGCATGHGSVQTEAQASAIDMQLDQMTRRVETLLGQLTALEQNRQRLPTPPQSVAETLPKDHPLMHPVSLIWQGNGVTAVQRVASQAGVRTAVVGQSVVMPNVVINARNEPLAKVLEDLSVKMGGRLVELAYIDGENLIEVRFLGAANKAEGDIK